MRCQAFGLNGSACDASRSRTCPSENFVKSAQNASGIALQVISVGLTSTGSGIVFPNVLVSRAIVPFERVALRVEGQGVGQVAVCCRSLESTVLGCHEQLVGCSPCSHRPRRAVLVDVKNEGFDSQPWPLFGWPTGSSPVGTTNVVRARPVSRSHDHAAIRAGWRSGIWGGVVPCC